MKEQQNNPPQRKKHLHDAFFRRVVLNSELCLALLRTTLPKEEFDLFDPATIQGEVGIFIDKSLKEHKSDAVVSLQFKESEHRLRIVFLFEHKSYRDPNVLTQILRYQSEIYSSAAYQKEKTPVYAVLLHQGRRPWNFSGNFQDSELVNFPPVARKILGKRFVDFTCAYLDLQQVNISEKTDHAALSLALFVMKNIWTLDDEKVESVLLASKDLVGEHKDLIEDVLNYIAEYDTRYSRMEKLLELEDRVLKEEEKFMEALVNPWEKRGEKRGEKKGEKKGEARGIRKAALGMLREGISLAKVHKITKLPKEELKRMKGG